MSCMGVWRRISVGWFDRVEPDSSGNHLPFSSLYAVERSEVSILTQVGQGTVSDRQGLHACPMPRVFPARFLICS